MNELVYFLSAIVCIAVFLWIYIYNRLVTVINYYATVNVSMTSRTQALAELTERVVWRTSATPEDKKEYKKLVKKLQSIPVPPLPEWMYGTFVSPQHCPQCGIVKLRRDKYGGLKLCLSCTKINKV